MKHEITVPEVSEGVTSGIIISISVAVGDQVEEDQTLLELETDKAVVEIPAPVAGQISDIKVAEGEKVVIGAVILSIDDAEAKVVILETPESGLLEEPAPTTVTLGPEREDPLPPPVRSKPAEQVLDMTPVRRDDQVAPAAPSVRRLARDLGVDIYQVLGTGPGGRICAEDVRLFVRDTMQQLTGGEAASITADEITGIYAQRPLPDFSKWGEISTKPLSQIRKLTADAVSFAWSTIPMVTQYDKAIIDGLEEFRKDYNYQATAEVKLTMTAILVKVCAAALKTFPQFNSSLDLARKTLILKHYQHIGIAVDTANGLLVPVIKDAGDKGIEELAVELNDLAEKSRQRKINPGDMEGGCFIISNLGGIGGNAFTPIVYAPQVAILGVSRAEMQPVWNGREFEPRLMLPLSLSYDHRVIDGADGARFLRWICVALENPIHLAMKG